MEIKKHISGLQHIGIPTNNLDKSVEFYESLGFEVIYKTMNEAADEKVTFLEINKLIIEIYENGKAEERSGAIDHIALDVMDISSVWEIIETKGYKFLNDKIEFLPFWKNGIKYFTIEGPNKERIEFCEYL